MKLGSSGAEKNNVLFDFLTGKPDEWVNRLLTVTESITKAELFQKGFEPLTKGELIQRVGAEEAERNINSGKYDVVYDSDDEA
eukprot:4036843-Pyramimonas_sp.AAC.1